MSAASTYSAGLTGAYFLNSRSLIQVEYLSSNNSSSFLSSTYETKHKTISAYYKRFAGNSFYWKTGLDYSQLRYTDTYDYWYSVGNVRRELEGNLVTASFVIGNQWQWDTFTLGCDWIGVSLPVTSDTTKKMATRIEDGDVITEPDDYDKRRLDDDEKQAFKEVRLQALRFYLGFSF